MNKEEKRKQKKEEKRRLAEMQASFFMDIWLKRKHYSEVSGKWLGKEALSIYFHHILPKSKWPEAAFDDENIILLTWDEHSKVEFDPFYFEEINNRREKLKEKYGRHRSS